MTAMPLAVRLPLALVSRGRSVSASLAHALGRAADARALAAFEFKCDEHRFVKTLLSDKPNLWAFRTNQRRFCGDFVVVDMSAPAPGARRVWVIDLKRGRPLKLGGGGAGIAFKNAARAVNEIARREGAVAGDVAYELVVGDRSQVLSYLGA